MSSRPCALRGFSFHALASTLLVVGAGAFGPASAVTYSELGDAGQRPSQAQTTATAGLPGAVLTAITGTILSSTDADLYLIDVADPLAFAASTFNSGTNDFLDTQLFLFTLAGAPIYMNDDDASGLSLQSTLPGGHPLRPTSAGSYLLGVSLSGVDPVNVNSQVLFDPLGSLVQSTDVRGPNPGLQPALLSDFAFSGLAGSGTYQVQLTGVAVPVPEPSTWLMLAVGAAGLPWLARRRLRSRSTAAA
jgi:PEP-CTERM motif